jgi:hypothetical protein
MHALATYSPGTHPKKSRTFDLFGIRVSTGTGLSEYEALQLAINNMTFTLATRKELRNTVKAPGLNLRGEPTTCTLHLSL